MSGPTRGPAHGGEEIPTFKQAIEKNLLLRDEPVLLCKDSEHHKFRRLEGIHRRRFIARRDVIPDQDAKLVNGKTEFPRRFVLGIANFRGLRNHGYCLDGSIVCHSDSAQYRWEHLGE